MAGTQKREPSRRLQAFLGATVKLLMIVLAVIVVLQCGNWLDDFLHAPIGIKDNPPEAGALVQLANLALWPTAGLYLAARILRFFAREFTVPQILGGLGGFLAWIFTVVLLVGEFMHREFIPGTFFLFRKVGPGAFAALLLGFDGLMAVLHMKRDGDPEEDEFHRKFAAVCFTLSTLSGVYGVVEFYLAPNSPFLLGAILATAVLFFCGLKAAPKTAEAKAKAAAEKAAKAEAMQTRY